MPANWIEPVTLSGLYVTMEPLSALHGAGLAEAVRDGELWRLDHDAAPAPEQMEQVIEQRLTEQAAGLSLPFAVMGRPQRHTIGMTSYLNIDAGRRQLEVGQTWYRGAAQRTAANTESKLLLLSYAFERLGCAMVRFRVSAANGRARQSIERLGARPQELLRQVPAAEALVYRIADGEWPGVKARLLGLLQRPYPNYTAAVWPRDRGTPVG